MPPFLQQTIPYNFLQSSPHILVNWGEHVLNPPSQPSKGLRILYQHASSLHPTSLKNVEMSPCQEQEGTAGRIESMQQSSAATPKNQDVGRGLRKIVACSQSSQCLLVSIVFGTVSSLHPLHF